MSDIHTNYVRDLSILLRDQALAARDAVRANNTDDFARGRAFAYYEVLSLVIGQAEAFSLPLREIGLEGFDADEALLATRDGKVKQGTRHACGA